MELKATFVDLLLFQRDKWNQLIQETAKPYIEQLLIDGAQAATDEAEQLGVVASFDVYDPQIQYWIDDYTFQFADKINAFAEGRFRTILSAGLQGGLTGRELIKAILDDPVLGLDGNKVRAELIARTETVRARIGGQLRGYDLSNANAREAGIPEPFIGKVWRHNPDACEFCVAMEGKQVDLGQDFFGFGESMEVEGVGTLKFNYEAVSGPPLHPKCRCTTEAVINPVYE